ncbi:MAG: hypothetical protein M1539_05670 [Actinobacteria bacterium]|nr:hypothetical protein [Actinomycetota bacterium]
MGIESRAQGGPAKSFVFDQALVIPGLDEPAGDAVELAGPVKRLGLAVVADAPEIVHDVSACHDEHSPLAQTRELAAGRGNCSSSRAQART